jgi:eukaryotic-like serine/threonine-protein kinase
VTSPSIGTLFGRYRIEGRLGAGGMGVVWRAHDPELRRDVALKVLPDEMVADGDARTRLLREARAAAALNHPAILTIYEVGEADGHVYIAMEYVPGRSLADVIPEGGMAPTDALRLGEQIASGLAHAHERGIVHRDIKPSNVLVTPTGDAKVLDFGIATRMTSETAETRSLALTAPGELVGTPQAIAPEQWHGKPADSRSDVWAFGALMYTLLAGRPPFRGGTVFELSTAICTGEPDALPERVPPGMRAVVARCLEREPERRYRSAAEVSAALHAIAAGSHSALPVASRSGRPRVFAWAVAAALLATVVVLLMRWRGMPGGGRNEITSLAVLPLESVSGNPDQQSFGDGMTGELITRIAQLGVVRVISRTSVMRFRASTLPLPQIARELGVDAIVVGTVEQSGGRVKISAELVRAATQEHLWGQSYERTLEDALALEDDVAAAIAHELRGALGPAATRSGAAKATPSPSRSATGAVVQAYLRGRDQYQRWTPSAERRAVDYFDQALALDSTFAPALAARGTALLMVSTSPDTVALARANIERALQRDPMLGEAHAARAKYLFELDWNWPEAEREFRRAIELNPNDADAHHHYSHLLMALGRGAESRKQAEIMLALDPLAPASRNHMSWLEYMFGHFDAAIAEERQAIALDPSYSQAFRQIVDVEVARRRWHAVRAALDDERNAGAPVDPELGRLADAAEHGRSDEALATLRRMLSSDDPFAIGWSDAAAWCEAMSQRDHAFALLDSAFAYRDYRLMFLNADPGFNVLRTDPRYVALRHRMKLPV